MSSTPPILSKFPAGGFRTGYASVVCHDLPVSEKGIFSTITLDEQEIVVRFAAPDNDDAVRGARVVRVQSRNESLREYGLQFDSPLEESTLEIN